MSDEAKIVAMVLAAILCTTGFIAASCNYQAKIDSQAPVVESCVKHPSTRSPFRGPQQ